MKYVLFYDAAADMDRAREVFPAHRAKWQEFVARGELLMIGPFSDPRQGAMGVFSTREAAEESCAWTVPSGGRGEEVGAARVERGDCFVSGQSYSRAGRLVRRTVRLMTHVSRGSTQNCF